MKTCPYCDIVLEDGAKFCANCGASVSPASEDAEPKIPTRYYFDEWKHSSKLRHFLAVGLQKLYQGLSLGCLIIFPVFLLLAILIAPARTELLSFSFGNLLFFLGFELAMKVVNYLATRDMCRWSRQIGAGVSVFARSKVLPPNVQMQRREIIFAMNYTDGLFLAHNSDKHKVLLLPFIFDCVAQVLFISLISTITSSLSATLAAFEWSELLGLISFGTFFLLALYIAALICHSVFNSKKIKEEEDWLKPYTPVAPAPDTATTSDTPDTPASLDSSDTPEQS